MFITHAIIKGLRRIRTYIFKDKLRPKEISNTYMGRGHSTSSLPVCGTAYPMSSEQQQASGSSRV